MNIDIRQSIIENFKGSSKKDISDSITGSLNEKSEETLPGLGVFFELVWQKATDSEKDKILDMIKDSLN